MAPLLPGDRNEDSQLNLCSYLERGSKAPKAYHRLLHEAMVG
jgi:hypothetical protein